MKRARDLFTPLGRIETIVALLMFGISVTAYVLQQLSTQKSSNLIIGYDRIQTTLILAGFAMLAYGIFWSIVCKICGWNYGEGAKSELPQGWEAVVLSFCTTLPLAILPSTFELITRKRLVLESHWRASAFMIVAAAVAHLLLYGTRAPRIEGLRDRIFPQGSPLDLGKALWMEFVYTIVHFLSTVFVYQLALDPTLSVSNLWSVTVKTLLSAAIFFIGACSYIVARYPASLVPVPVKRRDGSTVMDDQWAAARGVVNGAILMVAFTIGILWQ
jgi:hypothetical protein